MSSALPALPAVAKPVLGVKAPVGGTSGGPLGASLAGGAALTQRIVEQNAGLGAQERQWLAEQEKVKGNDCFR